MDTELRARLAATFRWVDPGPHCSHLVSDRSGWWRDPLVVQRVGTALGGLFPDARPTVVLAPEVTGFLVGPLVAAALGVGFVEAYRQDGNRVLAEPLTWADSPVDHRGRRLRLGVRGRLLGPTDRVLLVDDWVSTGAQLTALREVTATLGAQTVGAAAVMADCPPAVADRLGVRSLLRPADLPGG